MVSNTPVYKYFWRLRASRGRLMLASQRLGSRVRLSVVSLVFCDGRNSLGRGFSSFSLSQISIHYFYTLISFISSTTVTVRQA